MNIYYKLITPLKSKENNKYNYVYQITEISTGKKYIGSRGSMIEPNKDIKKYKSSSRDKQFKLNQPTQNGVSGNMHNHNNNDSIKVQYIPSSDVELTKRGFMEVKIVQEYNNDKSEYTTMFQTQTNTNNKEEGENE